MFDDFREDASKIETDEETYQEVEMGAPDRPQPYFLGMTPLQRFIISVELLFMVLITGAFVLLVLGRVVP